MYSETKNKILTTIKENNGTSAHAIITALNKNASGIFRHLKKMTEAGQLSKVGKPPKVLYYYHNDMEKNKTVNQAVGWALTGDSQLSAPDAICPTRDVFQARHDRLLNELKNSFDENLAFVVAAIAGEIGNNSFDHNLGNWRDAMGVLFIADWRGRQIILADRGQGVLSSIRRVRPQTANHQAALRAAFTEILSGRYPERRGNGLKFVAKNIQNSNLSLQFYSGDAFCEISGAGLAIGPADKNMPGTLAIIKF